MQKEKEFKYKVKNNDWRNDVTQRLEITQGYISTDKALTTRVRITTDISSNIKHAYITLKGKSSATLDGASECPEFEYEIPIQDAMYMMDQLSLKINKIRNIIPIKNTDLKWEIDEYLDQNLLGLVTAELEIKPGQPSAFQEPSWLDDDVSNNPEYKNVILAVRASEKGSANTFTP